MKIHPAIIPLIIAGAAPAACGSDAPAADNWQGHCASCHGSDGAGKTKMGQKLHVMDFTKVSEQAKFTDEEAFAAIMQGRVDSHGKLAEHLSDSEARALIQYVRSLRK
jgi:mono/diheme cytochrome c family protein